VLLVLQAAPKTTEKITLEQMCMPDGFSVASQCRNTKWNSKQQRKTIIHQATCSFLRKGTFLSICCVVSY